jgi:hypothetical protein
MSNNHHEYEQVHPNDDDDDDDDAEDIELVRGGGRQRSLGPPDAAGTTMTSSLSSITRWIVILFLMIVMYKLGMNEGKAVKGEDDGPNKHAKDTKKNKKYGTSFSLERVQTTRQAVQDLIAMLQEYYGGKEQSERMIFDSWLIPWDFERNVTKNNDFTDSLVEKLVDTMARALVTDDQKEFIIGVIGSSVAAGHDNCNYDSYERQMERTFGPVWEAAGMKLTCQNAGEGGGCGDDFANQVFCIQQNVSPNIDIAHCE